MLCLLYTDLGSWQRSCRPPSTLGYSGGEVALAIAFHARVVNQKLPPSSFTCFPEYTGLVLTVVNEFGHLRDKKVIAHPALPSPSRRRRCCHRARRGQTQSADG